MLTPRQKTKHALSMTIALLLAFRVQSASAQSPALTNTDVSRLVSMHVSDQTVIAVIREAKATQFDLKPLVVDDLAFHGVSVTVIAAMRRSGASAPTNAASAQSPPLARPQTLAEASEAAKAATHAWELSTNLGSTNVLVPSAAAASTPTVTKSEGTDTTTATKDEAWWRARMGGLRNELSMDKAACEPLAAKIRALQSTYDSYVFYDRDGTAKINTAAAATIETKLVEAKNEQQKCVAKVALDQTTIGTAEEEARRLGVLPGWLR
jgi:hypothetical protein